MDKIVFETENGTVEFFVLDQTRIGGTDYILVTEEEEGDSDALILKDTSKDGDEEALYEIVEDERELSAVAEVFAKMDDDIAFD